MPNLTLLETIPEFDADIRQKLAAFWIASAEEFVTTARSSNRQFGNGTSALAHALGITQDRIDALIKAADLVIPPAFSFDVLTELAVGTGAIFEGMEVVEEVSFDLPTELLPPEIDLSASLTPPMHQGKRNTCVAFTLAALYQLASGDTTDLSEQFLYWACKERDGIPGDVGTRPDVAMKALTEAGICAEPTWPYNPQPDNANAGQGPPPAAAPNEARQRRIASFTALPSKNLYRIQAALAKGQAVLFGLPINEHWTSAWQSRTLGRVRQPLPGEASLGGHAMAAVGYRDDPDAPGGGYFIVRNSWGTDWGSENPDGPGYAHIPYRLVSEQNLAAFVINGVAAEPRPETTTQPQSFNAPQPDIQALYAEARAIQQRLDALVAQLATLAQAQPEQLASSAPVAPTPAPAERASMPTSASELPIGPIATALPYAEVEANTDGVSVFVNGIDGVTGLPLAQINVPTASRMAIDNADPDELNLLHKEKVRQAKKQHLGLRFGINEDDLRESRWAIVVNADDDAALIKALSPLIEHRVREQGLRIPSLDVRPGERCGDWLARHVSDVNAPLFSGMPVLLYRHGETGSTWLERHGVAHGPVEPLQGVPFYLLLVGRSGPVTDGDSTALPFVFQYELDLFWGVGRLCFTASDGQHRLEAYTAYAEQVIAYEKSAAPIRKHAVFFGTRHDGDSATQSSAAELVLPLVQGKHQQPGVATAAGFAQRMLLAGDATHANLTGVLRGDNDGPPALLFSATHGIGLPSADPRLLDHQGALLCQDWTGFGTIKREHWFAAEDLPDPTRVDGMVMVCFACYGAGSPHEDQFAFQADAPRRLIAPYAFVAQLPQHLLTRGALAVLGHVDRAWNYSFSAAGAPAQVQAFHDVLARILAGKRLGFATDQFNMRQGAVAATLADRIEEGAFGKHLDPAMLAPLWVARNDARNYALLGDPAVRLRLARD